MKNEVFEKAARIKRSINTLDKMRNLIQGSTLRIFKHKIGFMSEDYYVSRVESNIIYFNELDKTTQTRITDAIESAINERKRELEEEYNNL